MLQKQIKIFLVEDEPLVLIGYKTILTEAGFQIIGEATDGQEAIEQIIDSKNNIDIVIIDINIPTLDGISVVERINEQHLIPCVIVTGYRDQQLVDRANKAGVFGYLQKPVDKYDLISTTHIAMERFIEYKTLCSQVKDARNALKERKLVEQAKGILMDSFGLKELQAMQYLQKKSRAKNKKLVEVAKDIIRANKLIEL